MGRHRAHAKFDRAGWRLRFLVPLWLVQVMLSAALLGVYGTLLWKTLEAWNKEEANGRHFPFVVVGWEGTNMALGVVAPCLVAFEMFKYRQETLTPNTVLITQFTTMAVSLASLVLSAYAHVHRFNTQSYIEVSLALNVLFVISSLIAALIAFQNHRRLASCYELSFRTNTKPYGFARESQQTLRKGVVRHSAMSSISNFHATDAAARPSSLRRVSSASSTFINRLSLNLGDPAPPDQPPPRPTSVYTHERDTQFEEYVSKRNSLQRLSLQESVDYALAAEFGWVGGTLESPSAEHITMRGINDGGAREGRPDVHKVPSVTAHSLGAVMEDVEEDSGGTSGSVSTYSYDARVSPVSTQRGRSVSTGWPLPEAGIEPARFGTDAPPPATDAEYRGAAHVGWGGDVMPPVEPKSRSYLT